MHTPRFTHLIINRTCRNDNHSNKKVRLYEKSSYHTQRAPHTHIHIHTYTHTRTKREIVRERERALAGIENRKTTVKK